MVFRQRTNGSVSLKCNGMASRNTYCACEKDLRPGQRRCSECNAQVSANWRERNPEELRRRQRDYHRTHRVKQYGVADYDALFDLYDGKCHICRKEQSVDRHLSIDHDHECCEEFPLCGECVRGLLCVVCNRNIAWFEKYGDAIAGYLESYQERRVLQVLP